MPTKRTQIYVSPKVEVSIALVGERSFGFCFAPLADPMQQGLFAFNMAAVFGLTAIFVPAAFLGSIRFEAAERCASRKPSDWQRGSLW